jgi:hypothetical protein
MKKILSISLILVLFFIFLAIGKTVYAANDGTIYFAGPTTALSPESVFTVSVLLDVDNPVNAVDFEISYLPEELKFLSSDDTRSIVDLWQTKPTKGASGSIVLIGGISKPFEGKGGSIINLTFEALGIGQSKLTFKKDSVYAADGKGTELAVNALIYNVSVIADAPKVIQISTLGTSDDADIVDNSPPEVFLEKTISSADRSSLIVFRATDPESGIQRTQMRVKRWWSFSDWVDVVNPVLRLEGAWSVELKAVNNVGLGTVKSLSWKDELYKKILLALSPIIILLIFIFLVYNIKKRRKRKI